MAATNQKIKDFFALSGNNPALTNAQIAKLATALGDRIHDDNSDATPDELVDFIYQEVRNPTIYFNRDKDAAVARDAVTF